MRTATLETTSSFTAPPLAKNPRKSPALRAVAVAQSIAANEALPSASPPGAARKVRRAILDTPGFRVIRDDATVGADGGVRWGWKQWIAIAKDVRKHLDKHGREHFASAVYKAQRKHLPKAQHRSIDSLSVACSPSASFNLEACIRFVSDHPEPLSLIGTTAPTPESMRRAPKLLEREPEPVKLDDPEAERKRVQREQKRRSRERARLKAQTKLEALAPPGYGDKAQDARDKRAAELDEQSQAQIELDKRKEEKRWQEGRIGPLNTPQEREQAKVKRAYNRRAVPQDEATPQVPLAAASADPMQVFLSTPVGVFLPALKAFMQSALGELFKPHHALIAETVRAAVSDVVGAPAPVMQQPTTQGSTPTETSVTPATHPDLSTLGFELALPNEDASPSVPEIALSVPEPVQETRQEQSAREALANAPHDLETQLALAAKALDIPLPGKRESVIVVGLHSHTQREVEKFYGRAFRFTFKHKHEFVGATDLSPTVDGVILCKTRLTHELLGVTRRYAIPTCNAANTSSAVLWALKQMFPDSAATFSEVRH